MIFANETRVAGDDNNIITRPMSVLTHVRESDPDHVGRLRIVADRDMVVRVDVLDESKLTARPDGLSVDRLLAALRADCEEVSCRPDGDGYLVTWRRGSGGSGGSSDAPPRRACASSELCGPQNVLEPRPVGDRLVFFATHLQECHDEARCNDPARGSPLRPPTGDARFSDAANAAFRTQYRASSIPKETQDHCVLIWGRTSREDGAQSVMVRVRCPVAFSIELPDLFTTDRQVAALVSAVEKETGVRMAYEVRTLTRAVGWVPDPDDPARAKRYQVMTARVRNRHEYNRVTRMLGRPVMIQNEPISVQLWETLDYYKSWQRFVIETGVDPGGWVVARNPRRPVSLVSTADLEYEVDARDLASDPDNQADAPLTIACMDIECINGSRKDRTRAKTVWQVSLVRPQYRNITPKIVSLKYRARPRDYKGWWKCVSE